MLQALMNERHIFFSLFLPENYNNVLWHFLSRNQWNNCLLPKLCACHIYSMFDKQIVSFLFITLLCINFIFLSQLWSLLESCLKIENWGWEISNWVNQKQLCNYNPKIITPNPEPGLSGETENPVCTAVKWGRLFIFFLKCVLLTMTWLIYETNLGDFFSFTL